MAAINQRIPNFLGGVSQQPDFIKFPGQLRTCHNAYPDVTFGLQKRAPGEYVGKLTNATDGGEWFEILRDGDERYLIQITSGNSPTIKVWDLADGTQKTVNFTGGASSDFSYLIKTGTPEENKPYGKLTINDYTIITNPAKTVAKARTTPTFGNNYAFVTLNEIAYNTEYVVALGTTNLTSTTKRRIESLEVVKAIGSGGNSITTWEWHTSDNSGTQGGGGDNFIGIDSSTPSGEGSATWQTSSPRSVYTGKEEYTGTTAGDAWEDVKFTVSVNATHFVNHYDSNNPNYDTQYTATVVLQDSGKDVGTGWANLYKVVNVNGQNWLVTIKSVSEYQSYTDSNAAVYRTVKNIKKGEITKDIVLGNIKKAIEDKYHGVGNNTVSVSVAGNGLYISANYAFNTIGVRGGLTGDSLEAFTDKAQNISKLPGTCKDGYIVKVSNTEDATSDDYYVKFITDATNGIGAGIWEETVAPDIDYGFNYTTMPHALINNRDDTFTWSALSWADSNNNNVNDYTAVGDNYWVDRTCGDDNTNPMPTFVGKKITQLFFVRNRLGLLAGEQVIISQPADYFNFFVGSAIAASDSDPIDMGASDVKPAILNYALPMQKGVMLFSEAAQFMLFTESENFSPKTAQLKKLSSYESTADFSPADTGTAVMFASNSSSFSKVFELILVGENQPPKVIEQTRVIPEFIPNDINRITNSAQAGVVTFGKLGSTDLYHYKYFDGGQQREQSAWFSWTLQGTLVHQLYSSGNFYSVTKQGSDFVLQRYELVVDTTSERAYKIGLGTVGSPTNIARRFEASVDNMCVYKENAQTGNPDANHTTTGLSIAYSGGNSIVTLPYTVLPANDPSNIQLIELLDGMVRVPDSASGATVTFNGVDLRQHKESTNTDQFGWAIGYKYTTEVALPTYYLAKDRGQYDVNADLRIHRLNFDLGVSGPMEFHVADTIRNKDNTDGETWKDYVHYESGVTTDLSKLSNVPSALYKNISVPIYKKNNKHDITVKIPAPFTATIVSASWDGSYNTRRHARQ